MDFFNKLGKQISTGANAVVNKTKDLTEVTKINIKISQDESKINELYNEIGRIYYTKNKDNPSEEFTAAFNQIKELTKSIIDSKHTVQQIKGIKICPACGAEIPADVAFCSSCGAKAPEAVVVEEEKPDTVVCPACGKVEKSTDTFCSVCGCKLK